jgi:hypothetical protein
MEVVRVYQVLSQEFRRDSLLSEKKIVGIYLNKDCADKFMKEQSLPNRTTGTTILYTLSEFDALRYRDGTLRPLSDNVLITTTSEPEKNNNSLLDFANIIVAHSKTL